MHQTPIVQIMQNLPSGCLLEIEKMTRSPFFNQRADVALLFKALRKQLVLKKIPDREQLYAQIWPDTPYKSEEFRVALFYLQNLVFSYLSIKSMMDHPTTATLELARSLRDIHLPSLAEQVLQKKADAFFREDRKDAEFQEQQFQFRAELMRANAGGTRTQFLELQELSSSLDKSFILRKLKTTAELLSHQRVFKVDYDFGMLTWVLDFLRQKPDWLELPEIRLYYNCCMSLLHPDDPSFFRNLQPELKIIEQIFPPGECREIVLLTLNYCIRKVNEGREEFAAEGLSLYQTALEKGYLLEKGEIDRFTFRNVVAIGIMLRSYQWVEQFIVEYSPRIALLHRESMTSFCKARLEYSRKNYQDAVGLLQKADYSDLLLNLAAKTLLMKIYFETNELRLLDSHLDSMSSFLRRKKLIAYHKENYQNIVKYARKLIALNRFERAAITGFREAINQEAFLTERAWFLQQTE